ncbi:hypothetical protein ABZ864_40800 [Streptomyces sp. NPDC047082]|uniref:hypothetical protein n=1 Tax=Streptomyces sp. NPDC047082 TaxID=3155259 RepID=UPI00340777DA
MTVDIAAVRSVAARAMAATHGEMNLPFQLTGSIALSLHGVLHRQLENPNMPLRDLNVNLTTPHDHDPDRAVQKIAGALQHSGWVATITEPAGLPGPMLRSVEVSGRDLETPVQLTTDMMPEYTDPPTQNIGGLAVSPLPTLLLRTVQHVQLRSDARDLIDLAAMEEELGPATVDHLMTGWLQGEASKSPGTDPTRLYESLHYGLARATTVSPKVLAAHGIPPLQAEALKDRVAAMAGRVATRAPQSEAGSRNALQRLLEMTPGELRLMRAEAEALGVEASHVERRLANPARAAEARRVAERDATVAGAELRRKTRQLRNGQPHQHNVPGSSPRPSLY